jgi:DNA invertase Pin-like site-specific DNA recombinase
MPLAYLYSRVSTPRQIDGLGLRRQAEERDKWLAAHPELHLNVVENYSDLGISARGKSRTEGKLGLILDRIADGTIPTGSYLICDSLDRISREELIDAHYLVSGIIRAGIVIVTIGDGMIFDRSDKERMMFNLLISLVVLARSSNESDSKSRNGLTLWATKRADAEASGTKLSAMTPAWIDTEKMMLGEKIIGRKFSLNRHAETVERIFELRAQGLGTALIVQKLIAEGREPMATGQRKDGGKWSRRYVALILENRAVLGDFSPGTKNHGTNDKRILTGKVIPDYFPPVSPRILDLWVRAQAIKTDRKVIDTRNRRGDFTNLFAGLCRCISCGNAMTIVHRKQSSRLSYLRCPARYNEKTCAEGRSYPYPALEAAVLDNLGLMLFDPIEKDFDIAFNDRAATLKLEIETVTNARRRLLTQYGEGDDDAGTLIRHHEQTRERLRQELAKLEQERSQAERRRHAVGEWEQVSKLRFVARNGTSDERQMARCKLREAVRSVISLLAFYPDGSVAVQTGRCCPVMVYRLSAARNGLFRLVLIVPMSDDDRPFGSAARLSYEEPEVKIEDIDLEADELATLNRLVDLRDRLAVSRGQVPNYLTETVKRRSDRVRAIDVKRLEAEMKEIEAHLSAA